MVRRGPAPAFAQVLALALALVLALALATVPAQAPAELSWQEKTPGQQMLKTYVEQVNVFLAEQGEAEINRIFELYESLAELGITQSPQAETPEGVEITVSLTFDSINTLVLRVRDAERFPRIAAAFLRALSPESMTLQQALKEPAARTEKAVKNPGNSFEDLVEGLSGETPRVYYAYYPNQYADGDNWLQMTVVFPLPGTWDGIKISTGETATRGPDSLSGADPEYEGYYSQDDYTHLETFATPTPEPDSPAGEAGPHWE